MALEISYSGRCWGSLHAVHMVMTAEQAASGKIQRRPLRKGLGLMVALLGASGIAFAGFGIFRFAGKGTGLRYLTQRVTRGTVVRAVTTSGTVNPVITVQVGAYVSGVIQARYCDYNTKVTKGQVCAKIDARTYQAVVDQSRATLGVGQAQLVKDQADLAYARIAYDRNRRLVATKSVSQDVLDSSKAAFDRAMAQIGLDWIRRPSPCSRRSCTPPRSIWATRTLCRRSTALSLVAASKWPRQSPQASKRRPSSSSRRT